MKFTSRLVGSPTLNYIAVASTRVTSVVTVMV